jgi:hypothetical protein
LNVNLGQVRLAIYTRYIYDGSDGGAIVMSMRGKLVSLIYLTILNIRILQVLLTSSSPSTFPT